VGNIKSLVLSLLANTFSFIVILSLVFGKTHKDCFISFGMTEVYVRKISFITIIDDDVNQSSAVSIILPTNNDFSCYILLVFLLTSIILLFIKNIL